jgi:hypothetical protein
MCFEIKVILGMMFGQVKPQRYMHDVEIELYVQDEMKSAKYA